MYLATSSVVSRCVSVLALAALVVLASGSVYAQLSTATVTGVVRDSSGGVIPNATVVLRNVDTSVERRSTTNTAGNYVFTNVPPGRYTMEVSAAGFKTNRVAEFGLAVNQTLTLDAALELGSLEQSVQVEATAEGVQSGGSTKPRVGSSEFYDGRDDLYTQGVDGFIHLVSRQLPVQDLVQARHGLG